MNKLIPYPVPLEVKFRLQGLAADAQYNRYLHGEDSKEHTTSMKTLFRYESKIRSEIGVEK